MIGRLTRAAVLTISITLGMVVGLTLALVIALVREPPSTALVDELIADPAVRASIEDEVIAAIDEEIELPLVDDQFDVVVETAVRSDRGSVVVADMARAVVAREFENGPDTIDVQLSSFIDELPSPLQLIGGLLDREVTIALPTTSSPPSSDRLSGGLALAVGSAAVWSLLTTFVVSRLRRGSSALVDVASLLLGAAITAAATPIAAGFVWSSSSDLAQRLVHRQLSESQGRILVLVLCLVVAGLGASLAAWLHARREPERQPQSAV